jgi:hypothetical protein
MSWNIVRFEIEHNVSHRLSIILNSYHLSQNKGSPRYLAFFYYNDIHPYATLAVDFDKSLN